VPAAPWPIEIRDESGIERLKGEATGQPSGVLSASVTLTNAEIKALPTTPISIVAAPGAGKMIVPVFGYVLSDLTTAYSGIDANTEVPNIWLSSVPSPNYLIPFVDDDSPLTVLTTLLTTTNEFRAQRHPSDARAAPVAERLQPARRRAVADRAASAGGLVRGRARDADSTTRGRCASG
jgi:hypothetical protein